MKIAKVAVNWDDASIDELAIEPARACTILNLMCSDEDDAIEKAESYVQAKGEHVSNVVAKFIKWATGEQLTELRES